MTCLSSFCLFPFPFSFFPQFFGSTFAFPCLLCLIPAPMDHVQGRAFHHHLARAIMHLNHLAGLLPFFEPSIEFDDMMPPSNIRGEHPTQRGLHTFVPLPSASTSPSMATHAGIPSRLIMNPEPNKSPTHFGLFSSSSRLSYTSLPDDHPSQSIPSSGTGGRTEP